MAVSEEETLTKPLHTGTIRMPREAETRLRSPPLGGRDLAVPERPSSPRAGLFWRQGRESIRRLVAGPENKRLSRARWD